MSEIEPASAGPKPMPRHVAIIMDGNGRWAAERGLSRIEGHRRGADTVRNVIKAAGELGIPYLTLFSFSSENWSRPANEVSALMELLRRFIRKHLAELHKNSVKLRMIGTRRGVDEGIIKLIEDAEKLTRDNSRLTLNMAFNYGARDEILRVARKLGREIENGRMTASDITEERFSAALDTAGIPDPDLLIRTSGELRISNFLLWQCAYTEFVFPEVYWPDFTRQEFEAAIHEYQRRDRRFGGRPARSTA